MVFQEYKRQVPKDINWISGYNGSQSSPLSLQDIGCINFRMERNTPIDSFYRCYAASQGFIFKGVEQ
jgi:hypothetical protein